MRLLFVAGLTALALSTSTARVLGACLSGQPASYDDVNFVLFERNACGGLGPQYEISTDLRCSIYWVSFWDRHRTTYSQHTLKDAIGIYTLEVSLKDARALLRQHDFYLLNPGEDTPTDIRESVLTVRRCGVVTRILMAQFPEADPATTALFNAFDDLVLKAKKTKISDKPQAFENTGLFEAL